MYKHAYLVIAHNQYEQLQLLVSLLDDRRNDIYVHIDRKSSRPNNLKTRYSGLYLLPESKSVDVRWGDVSQIQCELNLYETALRSGKPYSFFHLLSGVCLPIKPINSIYDFFEKHTGINFIGFCKYDENNYIDRILKRHYFTKYYKERSMINRAFLKMLRIIVEFCVNSISPQRRSYTIYKKGANWCSLTNEFVEYLIKNKDNILAHYKRSYCADEVYKQTLIWNSDFKKTIFNTHNEFEGCLRLIDWDRGNPYVFSSDEDYSLIAKSSAFYARKFDMSKYPEMIEYVKCLVCGNIDNK